eukprot:scaffold206764_cov19-Tisochrysis_lutea.AAC.1
MKRKAAAVTSRIQRPKTEICFTCNPSGGCFSNTLYTHSMQKAIHSSLCDPPSACKVEVQGRRLICQRGCCDGQLSLPAQC